MTNIIIATIIIPVAFFIPASLIIIVRKRFFLSGLGFFGVSNFFLSRYTGFLQSWDFDALAGGVPAREAFCAPDAGSVSAALTFSQFRIPRRRESLAGRQNSPRCGENPPPPPTHPPQTRPTTSPDTPAPNRSFFFRLRKGVIRKTHFGFRHVFFRHLVFPLSCAFLFFLSSRTMSLFPLGGA